MTRAIIRWSAENRWVVLLATAALVLFAVYTLRTIPVDAIPDLSDTQVIVYSRWDRSPDIVEDQVTYPIVTALLGAPKVKTIRGFSDFGYSYVYVIFEDGTDIYWARSRVVEYLSKIQPAPARGRAHRDRPRRHRRRLGLPVRARRRLGKAQPRRPAHVPGLDAALPPAVACRASPRSPPSAASSSSTRSRSTRTGSRPTASGSWRSPRRCAAPTSRWAAGSSRCRARSTWCAAAATSARRPTSRRSCCAPTRSGRRSSCATSAEVALGPEIRRGVGDLDGLGDAVGGIVVMRHGENARAVIERVRERLREVEPSLPEGVRDRDDLRPLGPHPAGHRHPEARAGPADGDREPRDPPLPLAHPLGDRAHPHHPHLGPPRLHPDVAPRHLLEHHVARRHRDLDRRPRRRRDRRGRERLQEARDLERRRAGKGDFHRCASRRSWRWGRPSSSRSS